MPDAKIIDKLIDLFILQAIDHQLQMVNRYPGIARNVFDAQIRFKKTHSFLHVLMYLVSVFLQELGQGALLFFRLQQIHHHYGRIYAGLLNKPGKSI